MSVSTLKQIFDQKLVETETATTTTTTTASATTILTNSPTKSKLLVANVQQNSTHEKIVVNNSNSCNNASRLKNNQQPQSFNKKSFDKDSNRNSAVSSAHNNNKIEDNWVSHHRPHNKMVAKQEIAIEPDVQAENEEDFKYGPGFVSKLKCKYLSLTLRQTSANKQRPSILDLRRSTSLNNLLDENEDDDDDIEQLDEVTDIKLHDKNCISNDKVYHENLKNNNRNGIDSHKTMTNSYPIPDAPQHQHIRSSRSIDKNLNLKRARSVEAILRYDHSSWERDMQKDQLIYRQEQQQFRHSIDSDNSDVKIKSHDVTIEDKINNARERTYNMPPKRLTSLIDDGERPPAGICKQTMRIFEASAHKKRNSATRPIGQEIASKMAIFKCQEKPAISAKKPNIVPRTSSPKPINHYNQVSNNTSSSSINSNNCNNSNNHNNAMNNSEKYAKFTKEKTVLPKLDINIIKNNLETKSSSPNSGSWSPADNKESYRMRNDYSPVNSDSSISSSSNIMSPYRNSMSPPFINEGSYKKISGSNDPTSPIISSLSNKLSNLHMDVTTSTPKSFKNNNLLKTIDDSDIDVNVDKIELISDNKIKNNVIVELKGSELKSLNDDISSVTKVITNNNNLSGVVATTASTKVNYEKNITENSSDVVNNGELKTIKDNFVITKPTTKPPPPPPPVPARNITAMTKNNINNNNNNNNNDKSSLNSDSESSSSSLSSSNSNTQTTKWAVKKKSWSSQGDDQSSNSIVFNFSDRKDVPDYIEHDGLILRRKRELPKGPASPCDVEFENANVIPNGKSSIRTRVKEVKFKIQFDDSLTATYEYPSESSLVIDETFGDCDDEVDANFYGRSSTSKLLTSVPLGSTPFANYQPQKASSSSFELGITRTTPSPSSASGSSSSEENTFISNPDDDEDYLKPATDAESHRWSSEGTRGTDLLF
ncbi:putative uncharacterized protein DDB_G0277255 isoform X2 [Chironomus tepperi]|uniref:putative uncharacterized protein DDB_G0277255 isoform X2 n=1 Tax=Chironomus tepperi TaxID=113505 RepID=UPI00391F139C